MLSDIGISRSEALTEAARPAPPATEFPSAKGKTMAQMLQDSGAKVLLALESLYDEVARGVVPGTAVELVLTTSELEHQTRHDAQRDR